MPAYRVIPLRVLYHTPADQQGQTYAAERRQAIGRHEVHEFVKVRRDHCLQRGPAPLRPRRAGRATG